MPSLPDQKPPFLRILRNIRLALQEAILISGLVLFLISILGVKWLT
ncbi:hypothetical protein MCEMSEM23_01870 [Rhabdaerophilaceae bacterium]